MHPFEGVLDTWCVYIASINVCRHQIWSVTKCYYTFWNIQAGFVYFQYLIKWMKIWDCTSTLISTLLNNSITIFGWTSSPVIRFTLDYKTQQALYMIITDNNFKIYNCFNRHPTSNLHYSGICILLPGLTTRNSLTLRIDQPSYTTHSSTYRAFLFYLYTWSIFVLAIWWPSISTGLLTESRRKRTHIFLLTRNIVNTETGLGCTYCIHYIIYHTLYKLSSIHSCSVCLQWISR